MNLRHELQQVHPLRNPCRRTAESFRGGLAAAALSHHVPDAVGFLDRVQILAIKILRQCRSEEPRAAFRELVLDRDLYRATELPQGGPSLAAGDLNVGGRADRVFVFSMDGEKGA